MARLLGEEGYKEVWPLGGGFDAWQALGLPVESVPVPPPPLTSISEVSFSA